MIWYSWIWVLSQRNILILSLLRPVAYYDSIRYLFASPMNEFIGIVRDVLKYVRSADGNLLKLIFSFATNKFDSKAVNIRLPNTLTTGHLRGVFHIYGEISMLIHSSQV